MTDRTSVTGESPSGIFATHSRNSFVLSLTPFTEGFVNLNTDPKRCGFRGRPHLIAQLTPALAQRIERSSSVAVMHWRQVLRTWWRFLDRAEHGSPGRTLRVETVSDLSDQLGLLAAKDAHIGRHFFREFRELASDARQAAGLPRLNWEGHKTMYVEAAPRTRTTRSKRPAA